MKAFVLGRSGAGKTPLARRLATNLGLQHVGASGWVRERFGRTAADFPSREAFVEAITAYSLEALRREPHACVGWLLARYDLGKPTVIEGVRNPYDFVHLFDPRTDRALFLEHLTATLPATGFEKGLQIIEAYLAQLVATGQARPEQVQRYAFGRLWPADPAPAALPPGAYATFDEAMAACEGALRQALGEPVLPGAEVGRVHADIPPLKARVRQEYLYNLDPARAGVWVDCTAFAVSSYPGHAPTFTVRIEDDGALFSYLPPEALRARELPAGEPELDRGDLVYLNCPEPEFVVNRFDYLRGRVLAYFKKRDLWLGGEYLFTMDWYLGNDLLHALKLDTGQVAFLPHHKVKFGNTDHGFRPYKKLRREWK